MGIVVTMKRRKRLTRSILKIALNTTMLMLINALEPPAGFSEVERTILKYDL